MHLSFTFPKMEAKDPADAAVKSESSSGSSCCKPKSGCCKPKSKQTPPVSCTPVSETESAAKSSCCKPKQKQDEEVKDSVKEYYGKVLGNSDDLKTNACCTSGAMNPRLKSALKNVHDEVLAKYYGCGGVEFDIVDGRRILDLGSGSGRDVYVLAQWVGADGFVVGVDMTDEQLEVARKHEEFHREKFGFNKSNVSFLKGYLEQLDQLDLEPASFDIITSNCVINLCPDKRTVLKQAFSLLKEGGMMEFSDVYAERRIPEALRKDPVLWGECLSGALYWADFERIAVECGFSKPLIIKDSVITIENSRVEEKIGHIGFYSVTYRLTKLPADELETTEEDYGQAVIYKGTIPEHEHEWELAFNMKFLTGKVTPVSGNTFSTLKYSRFASHFDFIGDKSRHYGPFEGVGGIRIPFKTAKQVGSVETTPVGGATSCC